MKQYGQFIKIFIMSFISFILLISILILIVNPMQSTGHSTFFRTQTMSLPDKKVNLMSKDKSFKTLIIGSSTSEVFNPVDVNFYLKTKSFIASTGGASATTRYAISRFAIDNWKDLKNIIYVADIFEFKEVIAKSSVYNNQYLGNYLKELQISEIEPPLIKRVQDFLSHQAIESATTVIKKYLKHKGLHLKNDGQLKSSMIRSPIKDTKSTPKKMSPEIKRKLILEIEKNFYNYSTAVLNDFTELSPAIINIFKDLVKQVKKHNIKITFFLSPYHPLFKTKLSTMKDFDLRYREWVTFMESLHDGKNIFVYNLLNHPMIKDPDLYIWRDGIHYFRAFAIKYLNLLKNTTNE